MKLAPQELCDALNIDIRDVKDIRELKNNKVRITFNDGHSVIFKIEYLSHYT